MSAKNVAEATLSVAGTMVWSKRIVMAHLQVVCSGFRRSVERVVVMPTSGLPHAHARPMPGSDNSARLVTEAPIAQTHCCCLEKLCSPVYQYASMGSTALPCRSAASVGPDAEAAYRLTSDPPIACPRAS